jgi:DNA-binding transcriptional LysR family regulator
LWRPIVPELRHLRVFLAVADARNFTRAAERLHLAQQAVSKSVSQLERELGVALLVRTTRDVRLTDAGRRLAEDAREIIATADAAFARARDHGRGLAGSVTIGATAAVGVGILDRVARLLRREAPALSVVLREVRPAEIGTVLRDGIADVVLVRTTGSAPEMESVVLAPTPAALVVPADHRLAGEEGVELSAIDGERLLVWSSPGTPFTDLLVRLCAGAGAAVTPVESAVIGAAGLAELHARGAVALVAEGSGVGPGEVAIPLRGEVTLPLLAVLPAGPPAPAVARILALLAPRVAHR